MDQSKSQSFFALFHFCYFLFYFLMIIIIIAYRCSIQALFYLSILSTEMPKYFLDISTIEIIHNVKPTVTNIYWAAADTKSNQKVSRNGIHHEREFWMARCYQARGKIAFGSECNLFILAVIDRHQNLIKTSSPPIIATTVTTSLFSKMLCVFN